MRLLGFYLLALQVQGAGTSDQAGGQDLIALVSRSSPIAKLVLLVLILFSIASWGIILYKLWALNRAERQSSAFLDVFRRSSKFSEVHAVCKNLSESPLVGIFQAGYAELNTQLRQTPATGSPPAGAPRPTLRSLQSLDRALLRAAAVEVNKLESRVSFLALAARGRFTCMPCVIIGAATMKMMSSTSITSTSGTTLISARAVTTRRERPRRGPSTDSSDCSFGIESPYVKFRSEMFRNSSEKSSISEASSFTREARWL